MVSYRIRSALACLGGAALVTVVGEVLPLGTEAPQIAAASRARSSRATPTARRRSSPAQRDAVAPPSAKEPHRGRAGGRGGQPDRQRGHPALALDDRNIGQRWRRRRAAWRGIAGVDLANQVGDEL